MAIQLTEAAVKELVVDWYKKLDVHVPMVDILPCLASEGAEMKFPEVTLTTLAGFEGWYQRVIRIFFDEVHTVKKADVTIKGDVAEVDVVVEWQASVWNAPAANSARIVLDAIQFWKVKIDSITGKPVIASYAVNDLVYHEGSARL